MLRTYPEYSRANSYPWCFFPPRRARPGPGPHTGRNQLERRVQDPVLTADAINLNGVCGINFQGSYLRLIDSVSLSLRLKDLLGPVTRVKKKKKLAGAGSGDERAGAAPARPRPLPQPHPVQGTPPHPCCPAIYHLYVCMYAYLYLYVYVYYVYVLYVCIYGASAAPARVRYRNPTPYTVSPPTPTSPLGGVAVSYERGTL